MEGDKDNGPAANLPQSLSRASTGSDLWTIASSELHINASVPWKELSARRKVKRVIFGTFKAIALLACLYFFICSLDVLSRGFRLVGGRTTSKIFRNSKYIQNPIVGVMVGLLVTVILQSSSATSSILVSMVAADFLRVHVAIPIVMGANIGTSITNTFVSLGQVSERDQFRRAFAGAIVHDMFNWLTVIVLLPVEVCFSYLERFSGFMVLGIGEGSQVAHFEFLDVFTKPFVNLIAEVDTKVVECWTNPKCTEFGQDASLLKRNCARTPKYKTCPSLFAYFHLSDPVSGALIILGSLVVLCGCLLLIVKILTSILRGPLRRIMKKTLNAEVKGAPWITGYLAIFVGAVLTFLIQSSSVFTSALTPLVGLGIITVERMYPLTLGSNVGTTTTALMASLSVQGPAFKPSVQIALCHFLFNVTGILLFYPIPFMRFPIRMAKFLGKTTAKYRWFSIVYLVLTFIALPGLFLGLSLAGSVYVVVVTGIMISTIVIIFLMNLIMRKCPKILHPTFRTWNWLPIWFRSLEPYDKIVLYFSCCRNLKAKTVTLKEPEAEEASEAQVAETPKCTDLTTGQGKPEQVEEKKTEVNGSV